ncbi:alphaTry family protein [Megaselia abdita]
MKFIVLMLALCAIVQSVFGIIGGNQADIKQHPYQVAILSSGKFVSSGIIIKNNAVLTDITAHRQLLLKYTFPGHNGTLSVRAGSSQKEEGGVEVSVKSSNVIKSSFEDLSVLYLDQPLVFNDNISNIPLMDRSPRIGANCSISGWGVNDTNFNYPLNLQSVNVSLVASSNCGVLNSNEPTVEGMFCLRGGDACVGDSGAPLVCEGVLVWSGFVFTGLQSRPVWRKLH